MDLKLSLDLNNMVCSDFCSKKQTFGSFFDVLAEQQNIEEEVGVIKIIVAWSSSNNY